MSYCSMEVGDIKTVALALTNAVIVSPGEFKQFAGDGAKSYVEVKIKDPAGSTVVYEVLPNEAAGKGEVLLNKPQKKLLCVEEKMVLELKPFPYTLDPTRVLQNLELEVEPLHVKVKGVIDEEGVVDFVMDRFKEHLFCRGQVVCIDYFGVKLGLKVKNLKMVEVEESKESGKSMRDARVGFLSKIATELKVTCSTVAKNITWKPSKRKGESIMNPDLKPEDMGIGGLGTEFMTIFRRAFASRMFPASEIKAIGLKHVKGMLLYGPPGTGKTLIARKIGQLLKFREPKIVNGPDVLSKWVGEAEKNIRELFKDAEDDWRANKENSDTHLIIFDEIDAICKQRGSVRDGTGTHDTIVNQLLAKIDGVEELNNFFIIGMTNRKDMIDEALLRPGRLELHIQIGLPDEPGRADILAIHTKKLKEKGNLGDDVDLKELASLTKNFSGAELEGLVKSACSNALVEVVEAKDNDVKARSLVGKQICRKHFMLALEECKPAFGVEEDTLNNFIRQGIIRYSPEFERVYEVGTRLIGQISSSESTPLLSLLIEGRPGSGTTALAAHLGIVSRFPYVKIITPEELVSYGEVGKSSKITRVFEDAYKSKLSLIIIDNIERLLEYVRLGPRFSNIVYQTLLVLLKKSPPVGHRLMIIGTTSDPNLVDDLSIRDFFQVSETVPLVRGGEAIAKVFKEINAKISEEELKKVAAEADIAVGIKKLLLAIEMASHLSDDGTVTFLNFLACIRDFGV